MVAIITVIAIFLPFSCAVEASEGPQAFAVSVGLLLS